MVSDVPPKDVQKIEGAQLQEMLEKRERPILLFTDAERAHNLCNNDPAPGNCHQDCKEHSFLRQLGEKTDGKFPLLVVTDPKLMRGYDYRSTVGIDLVIDKQFASEREMIQGLNRVGRNGDDCKRFTLVDPLVDMKQQAQAQGMLNQLSNLGKRKAPVPSGELENDPATGSRTTRNSTNKKQAVSEKKN